jgi:type I restriction enzyme S subunit
MSLPTYPECKESGVAWLGGVPTHWDVRRLKTELRLLTEKTERRTNPVALENIEGWSGRFILTETEFEGDGVAFEFGDILFGKLRPYLAKVYLADFPGEAVGDFHVLRPSQAVLGAFAQYQILTRAFIDVIDGSTFGSKMPRASWESLGSMPLVIPPLLEQASIVSFLDVETAKIDTLISNQEKLIKLLAEKRQATISHAVTKGLNPNVPMKDSGVEWLGEVPEHWEVVGLTKYIESVVDYRGKTPTKVDDGIFLVTAKNIRNGEIDYDSSQEYIASEEYVDVMRRGKPEIGDVLFTTEAPLGQVAQIDRTDIALAQRVIKFRGNTERLNNEFLKYWIMGSHCQFNLMQLATGSTALGIKGSKVGQVQLCLPPIQEQVEIISYLKREFPLLDGLSAEAVRGIELLKERRGALISAAVTGKIDVRQAIQQEQITIQEAA